MCQGNRSSGATRSPEPAPMPCGSCSKAAALDSIADTKTEEMKDSLISSQQREKKRTERFTVRGRAGDKGKDTSKE